MHLKNLTNPKKKFLLTTSRDILDRPKDVQIHPKKIFHLVEKNYLKMRI